MKEEVESVVTTVSQKAVFWSALVSVLSSLSADRVFGAIGALVAIISALTARYYMKRRDAREAAAFEAGQRRKDALLAAQLEFFKQRTAMDDAGVLEAKALGIDTDMFPPSDHGKL